MSTYTGNELAARADGGEVPRVAEPLPWHFNSDALQLGHVLEGPCVRITKWLRHDSLFAVRMCDRASVINDVTTPHLSEAIGIAEAWWKRQGE